MKLLKNSFNYTKGPYEIAKVLENNAFILSDENDEKVVIGTYNRKNLRQYFRCSKNKNNVKAVYNVSI